MKRVWAYSANVLHVIHVEGITQLKMCSCSIESAMPEASNNTEAWKVLERWQKPFLTTFSDSDPIFNGQSKHFTVR